MKKEFGIFILYSDYSSLFSVLKEEGDREKKGCIYGNPRWEKKVNVKAG